MGIFEGRARGTQKEKENIGVTPRADGPRDRRPTCRRSGVRRSRCRGAAPEEKEKEIRGRGTTSAGVHATSGILGFDSAARRDADLFLKPETTRTAQTSRGRSGQTGAV